MIKASIKREAALLLSVSILAGIFLSATDSISVYADTSSELSVSAYADKDTLAGDTFKPKYDNEGNFTGIVGKLKFGKRYVSSTKTEDLEWYILGCDSGVANNNTAIFAAENMIEGGIRFRGSLDEITFEETMGAYEGDAPDKVYCNHYGASVVRALLNYIAGDGNSTNAYEKYKNLLSTTEKKLLNATSVKTEDYRNTDEDNKPRYYSISDKLYAPAGGPTLNTKNIYVGSSDQRISIKTYWADSGNWFWLRSPYSGFRNYSLIARPNADVYHLSAFRGYDGVRPASNLNLTDVSFASAALPSESDTQPELYAEVIVHDISADAAMGLRLDGEGKDIGKVFYDSNSNTVTAIKGDTDSKVSLVIQGKTDNKDWYISERVDDYYLIKLDKSKGYDVSKCKIWLEISADDESSSLAYAIEATQHNHTYDDNTWIPLDEKYHTRQCIDENCPDPYKGKYDPDNLKAHTYGDDNVCTTCGYRKGDHIVYRVDEKPATRTSVGYREHFECSHCDMWFIYPALLGTLTEKPRSYFEIPKKDGGSSSSGSSSSNINTGWIKDTKGWRYRNSDGILAQGTTVTDKEGNKIEKLLWQRAGYGYFAFGSDSYLVTGWIYDKLEDKWYYCDENKGKLYGWFLSPEDGYWYYLSLSTGEALTGWQSINGKDYCFASAPSAPTYSYDAATGFWIYSNIQGIRPFGSMYASTVTPDNYTVDASGAWVH